MRCPRVWLLTHFRCLLPSHLRCWNHVCSLERKMCFVFLFVFYLFFKSVLNQRRGPRGTMGSPVNAYDDPVIAPVQVNL